MSAIAFALVVFGVTLARAVIYVPAEPESRVEQPRAASTASSLQRGRLPARLIIPTIGIDASVEHVGITASGNMAVPASYENAGWYRLGAVPGESGSAVIAGHVTNGLNLPGVFFRLDELKRGDEVIVETSDGGSIRFTVLAVERYPYDEVPREELFNDVDAMRLNLVTCDGVWIMSKRTYDRRLVVYTARSA